MEAINQTLVHESANGVAPVDGAGDEYKVIDQMVANMDIDANNAAAYSQQQQQVQDATSSDDKVRPSVASKVSASKKTTDGKSKRSQCALM